MHTIREAGRLALQNGRLDEAISRLRLACEEDPLDFEAHWYLGAAYGTAGRHDEAVQSLAAAVHLRPSSAQARYNLGVALESVGSPDEARAAYQQALALEPDYEKALSAAERLKQREHLVENRGKAASPASSPASAGGLEPAWPLQTGPPVSSAPVSTQALPSVPAPAFRAAAPQQPEAWQNPEPSGGDPGFIATAPRPGAAALPSHGLLNEYAGPPRAPAGAPSVDGATFGELPPPNYGDEIDIPRTFREFGRILVTPDRFLQEQAGRSGMMSPFLMVGLFLAIELVSGFLGNGVQSVISFAVRTLISPVALAAAGAWMIVMYLISALVIHFIGGWFGNRQDYSMSFRACVYADAPRFLSTLLIALYMTVFVLPALRSHPISDADLDRALGVPPGTSAGASRAPDASEAPGSSHSPAGSRGSASAPAVTAGSSGTVPGPPPGSPQSLLRLGTLLWRHFGGMLSSSLILGTLGCVWSTVLLVLAIHRLQQISPGAAIGVVLTMYLIGFLLIALIVLGFAGIVVAVMSAALHSSGAAGGAHP